MRKILFFITSAIIAHVSVQAQVTLWDELKKSDQHVMLAVSDTTAMKQDESLYIPESWDTDLDSLLSTWHLNYYTNKDHGRKGPNPIVSDSVYIERLHRLPRIVPLTYNEIVRTYIDLYAERRRGLVERMLGWADYYFPMIEQTLDSYDLPLELKYLAVVESALNPTALSRAGASGLWQFILPTGKRYGLEINSLVDERRDPIKSTHAACKYFKDMYAIYKDWNLVIASYNCGPGNVNKAIKRSKGKTDFWEIYQFLPKETRTYVPLFIAANYIMSYYNEHNLYPDKIDFPFSTDTVMINKEIHFDQVANILKIEKELLQALNPQYRREIIPGHAKPYVLTLPALYAYGFVELEDTIASYRSEELFANKIKSDSNQEKIRHKVKSGETLLSIANRYGVRSSEIKKWNGLRSNKVATGKSLVVYVNNGGYSIDPETKTTETKTTKPSSKKSKLQTNSSYISYKVKSGDSYYSIAKNYPGVSPKDLMEINNVKSSSLKAGQVIKIPQV